MMNVVVSAGEIADSFQQFGNGIRGINSNPYDGAPDDGFVVLDLNGNGRIGSGREMFGDQTLKPLRYIAEQ